MVGWRWSIIILDFENKKEKCPSKNYAKTSLCSLFFRKSSIESGKKCLLLLMNIKRMGFIILLKSSGKKSFRRVFLVCDFFFNLRCCFLLWNKRKGVNKISTRIKLCFYTIFAIRISTIYIRRKLWYIVYIPLIKPVYHQVV